MAVEEDAPEQGADEMVEAAEEEEEVTEGAMTINWIKTRD